MNSKKNSSTTKSLPLDTGETPSIPEEPITEEVAVPESTPSNPSVGGKTRRFSKYGSRRKVWNGTAEKTKGGLRKEDLTKNKYGRIVSTKRHTRMKNRE